MSVAAALVSGSLRALPWGARVGISALLLVLAGGLAASGAHLQNQHQNRDERPGVSLLDIEGAYHGVEATAPLVVQLRAGHPEELPAPERELLLSWLSSKRISEDYDSLELGVDAPAEVLARRCVECHSRTGLEGAHGDARIALGTWPEVSKVAFSRRVEPLPTAVLAASTHAHALGLGSLSLVLALFLFLTRFPALLSAALCGLAGVALLVDLGSWWLARSSAGLAPLLVAAGACYAAASALSIVLVFLDLWLPRRGGPR